MYKYSFIKKQETDTLGSYIIHLIDDAGIWPVVDVWVDFPKPIKVLDMHALAEKQVKLETAKQTDLQLKAAEAFTHAITAKIKDLTDRLNQKDIIAGLAAYEGAEKIEVIQRRVNEVLEALEIAGQQVLDRLPDKQ